MVFSGQSPAPPRWANGMGPGWSRNGQRRGGGTLAGAEDRLAVVAQLGHALPDVVEGAVAAGLDRCRRELLRVPAPAQLLHRRDVDRPVVEMAVDVGQMGDEEGAVGADGVAHSGTVRAWGTCARRNSSVA